MSNKTRVAKFNSKSFWHLYEDSLNIALNSLERSNKFVWREKV